MHSFLFIIKGRHVCKVHQVKCETISDLFSAMKNAIMFQGQYNSQMEYQ